ncbi:MAG: argininosuccinate lyase [Clostridia bacterium]|nr:argininosuccinate lyase [Clostridia bacterium]
MTGGKVWGGRFREPAAAEAEAFTASLAFDRRLWPEDLAGSRAHVRMLAASGILAQEEAEQLLGGLEAVEAEIRAGSFPWRREDEDVHMAVERRLTELVGPVAGKLHTARSRNDQVALDTHLWARSAAERLAGRVTALQAALLELAERAPGTVMPGYTHLQHAQPVLWAHHWLAFFFMFQRDRERLLRAGEAADRMPLGAGALAGTPFPVDPARVAAELGFSRLYENSMDAVSDRDYLAELLFACALAAAHLSRLGETLVLWSSREFGFVEFADAYATGSSIMPQKKNPDVAELVRGKAGRVYGDLLALLTVLKGLPLAYASDLQEDKEAAFDAVDTLDRSLGALTGALRTLRVDVSRLEQATAGDYSTATELADHLAARGLPFREAHRLAGRIVADCLEAGRPLEALGLEELRRYSPLFEADVLEALRPAVSAARRRSPGGTAPERVREQMELAHRLLEGVSADG